MPADRLIARLAESAGRVPARVPVHEVRQHTVDDLHDRTRGLLEVAGDTFGVAWQRADWTTQDDRTFVRLPEGAHAVVWHASGTMTVSSGLAPMAMPFDTIPPREELEELVRRRTEELRLTSWVGTDDVRFERLWQVKAAGAAREGRMSEPTLFRTVGAYRQHVSGLPVWGRASLAVKLADAGAFDSATMHVRQTTGEVIDEVSTVPPDTGAAAVVAQLEALLGRSDVSLDEIAQPQWMHFGYLSLSPRKAQRVLEPVYVAAVHLEGEYPQGYLLAVNAGTKVYQPLNRSGSEPPPGRRRMPAPA